MTILGVSACAGFVTPTSAEGWDYVYGDPGPANFSRYQDVELAASGDVFLAGFYSGSFNGLSSTDAYRYFVQRIGTAGGVVWTREIATPPLATQTVPAVPDLVIDGLGNPFIRTQDIWTALDDDGTFVASMPIPQSWPSPRYSNMVPAPDGGFVAVVGESNPTVQHRGPELGLLWELPLTGLVDSPSICAFCAGAIAALVAVPDGTYWLVGRKTRVLATQQDALSMVHIGAGGGQIAAIRHNGIVPRELFSANPILGASADFIWISVNDGVADPGGRTVSFSTTDGHQLGIVPTSLPADDITTPTGTVNCGGLDMTAERDASNSQAGESVVLRRSVLVNGTRLVVLARCGNAGTTIGQRATVLLSYSMNGMVGGDYALTASRALSTTTAIQAMDADDLGNAVVVGSTTDGVVYAGPVESVRLRYQASSNERAVATRNPLGNLNDLAEFKSVVPGRLVDTRPGEPDGAAVVVKRKYGGANILTVTVAGKLGLPSKGAGAVSLNVTAVNPAGAGFLTVFPCGSVPNASSLNFTTGQIVPNAVLTPISASGTVCFFSNVDTHILVDVNGWFRAGSGFTPVAPVRLFDTRATEPSGLVAVTKSTYGGANELRARVVGVGGVPGSGVGAVSLNVTAVAPEGPGFVTVYPCGSRPGASNLNFSTGQVVPNAVIAPVSESGEICLFSNVATHLLADVNGWFATGSSFHAVPPFRAFDSRPGEPDGAAVVTKQRYGGASVLRVSVVGLGGSTPVGVTAVSLNVTVAEPEAGGFLTVYPCGSRPLASNLNFSAGQVVPNAVIAPVSAQGEVCFFSNVGTYVIADINGWITD